MRLVAALAAFLLVGAGFSQDSNRSRRTLIGGATIFVESMPGTGKVSLQVVASARGTEDTPETHGFRHMLEHLTALGRTGKVDELLEGEGLYLTAATYLETMRLEVSCRRSQVPLVMKAFDDILGGLSVTEDDIKREARLIREELALISDRRTRFREIVQMAGDAPQLDPLGAPELMVRATPAQLEALHQTHFCQANLTISVTGDLSLTEGENWAEQISARAPASPALPLEWRKKRTLKPMRMLQDTDWTFAMPLEELLAPRSLARVVQGFGLAALAGGEVSFSPSRDAGVILIDVPNDDTFRWAKMQPADVITSAGYRAMRRWFDAELSDPARLGWLRGRFIAAQPYLSPERVIEGARDLKSNSKQGAWEDWIRLCQS